MASTGEHGDHGSGARSGGRRRPSAAVYRRRRLAVTILALLVLAALVVGGVALAGAIGRAADAAAGDAPTPGTAAPATDDPSAAPGTAPATTAPARPTATPTPSTTAVPSPRPTASAGASATPSGAADACDPGAVVVEAETDRQEYGPDDTVVLSLVVRNTGDTACSVNVGTSQMEFLVTSGDERVFSSIDCQQASQDLQRTIAPGADEHARFEWSRSRSMPGCTPAEEEPGAGEYTLTTKLGVRDSSPVDFTLQ